MAPPEAAETGTSMTGPRYSGDRRNRHGDLVQTRRNESGERWIDPLSSDHNLRRGVHGCRSGNRRALVGRTGRSAVRSRLRHYCLSNIVAKHGALLDVKVRVNGRVECGSPPSKAIALIAVASFGNR